MIEINKTILELLEIDDAELKEITSEQRVKLRHHFTSNLSFNNVYYSEGYGILFTSESTYNNWRYYAGFEYIKNFDLIKVSGKFYAFFSNQEERVESLIKTFDN